MLNVRPSAQYAPGAATSERRYEVRRLRGSPAALAASRPPAQPATSAARPPQVRFGDVKLTHPAHTEAEDNSVTPLYPADARLRNATYESLLLVDVHKSAFSALTSEPEGEEAVSQEWVGSIPVMVQSAYCRLRHMTDKDKVRFGECVFDQVRCGGRAAALASVDLRALAHGAREADLAFPPPPPPPPLLSRAATSSSTAAKRC